jgi:hypothetical protein
VPAASAEVICNMALGYAGVRSRINSILEPSAVAQACNTYYDQYRRSLLNDYRWPFAKRRMDLVALTGAAWVSTQTYAAGDLISYGATVYRSLAAANTGHTPGPSSTAWWAQVTRDGWGFAYPLPSDFVDEHFIYQKPSISATSVINSFFPGVPTTFGPIRTPRNEERVPFDIEDADDGSGTALLLTDADRAVLVYTADITNPQSFSDPYTKALAYRLAVALVMVLRADPKAAELMEKKAEAEVRESVATEMRGIIQDPEPASDFEAAREQ